MFKEHHSEFSSLRTFFWPVHRHELKKLLPMLFIFFLLSFCYNTLRTMKDILAISNPGAGARVIPFIKMWVMFPGTVLLTFLFTRLSNRLQRETVFYWMLSLFLGFFGLFAFFIYPNMELMNADRFADFLTLRLPEGAAGFIAMIRYWPCSIFYAMSELWSNIVLFLLFWGFANEVTKIGEAKRFYGLLGIGANSSGIAAGYFSMLIMDKNFIPNLPFGQSVWEQKLSIVILFILAAGFLALILHRWMHLNVLTSSDYEQAIQQGPNQKRRRMSMSDNFRYLFNSKYLIMIAAITILYNVIINLVEVLWKDRVWSMLLDKDAYGLYMNEVTMIIGLIATITSAFVSTNLIRRFGWTTTAMLTPAILLITSVAFFTFFFENDLLNNISLALTGLSPLTLCAFFGTAQNCLSRAAKYTVYDTTKEIAFVPLSSDCKIKGKAAIDGVCNRLGKSGGAAILQMLLFIFVDVASCAPYAAVLIFIFIGIWMGAVLSLGRQFNALTEGKKEITTQTDITVVELDNAGLEPVTSSTDIEAVASSAGLGAAVVS